MTNELCVFNDKRYPDMYTSFKPVTMEEKTKLYNAINNPDERISAMINKPIAIKDVIVRIVKLTSKKVKGDNDTTWTEEEADRDGFRVIIVGDDGKTYTATSTGIYNSICTIQAIFGTLHFDEPLNVEVQQVQTKNGSTLTLKVIG